MEGAHYTHFGPLGKQKPAFLRVAVIAGIRYSAPRQNAFWRARR